MYFVGCGKAGVGSDSYSLWELLKLWSVPGDGNQAGAWPFRIPGLELGAHPSIALLRAAERRTRPVLPDLPTETQEPPGRDLS